MLDADKKFPGMDAEIIAGSNVFYVPAIIVRNQIYAGIYVTKELQVLDAVLPLLDAA